MNDSYIYVAEDCPICFEMGGVFFAKSAENRRIFLLCPHCGIAWSEFPFPSDFGCRAYDYFAKKGYFLISGISSKPPILPFKVEKAYLYSQWDGFFYPSEGFLGLESFD